MKLENYQSEHAGKIEDVIDSLPSFTKGLTLEQSRIEKLAREIDIAHEMSILVAALYESKLTKEEVIDLLNEYSLWLYDVKQFFYKAYDPYHGGLVLAAYGYRILSNIFEAAKTGKKILARDKGELKASSLFPVLKF